MTHRAAVDPQGQVRSRCGGRGDEDRCTFLAGEVDCPACLVDWGEVEPEGLAAVVLEGVAS